MGKYALANRRPLRGQDLYNYGAKAIEGLYDDDPLTGTQTPQTENNAVVDYARAYAESQPKSAASGDGNVQTSNRINDGGAPTQTTVQTPTATGTPPMKTAGTALNTDGTKTQTQTPTQTSAEPMSAEDKKAMNDYLKRTGRAPVEDGTPAVSEDDLKYWGDQYEAAMPRPTARTDEELRNDIASYLGFTPLSPKDEEAERRRARIAVGMEGIGRGLGNLANLYYTTQWAPSQDLGVSQTWKNWLAERKERDAKNARYLAEFTRLQRENQRAIEDYEKRKGSYVASMMRRAIDAKNREETDNRRQGQKIEFEEMKTEGKKSINEANNATKVEVAKINVEGKKDVANINQSGADRRNAADNKVKESEGEKNRTSREKIAQDKRVRGGSRARGGGSGRDYSQYER